MTDQEIEALIGGRAYDREALEQSVASYLRRANYTLEEIATVLGCDRRTVSNRLKKQ